MIKGLTHDENGIINQTIKYKGKISTGFGPGEGPNKENHPIPCGYFRILKEITINERISGQPVVRKEWKINEELQKKLEDTLNGSKTPRKLDFMCLFSNPEQLWESNLAMYSQTEGLLCRGNGIGTIAKELKKGSRGEREWVDRECKFKECPDFKAGRCKAIGLMKIFPLVDISTNPYRFETRSIYTINGIEASLYKLWKLCEAAHKVRKLEAKKDIPFEGFFGMQMSLIHKKAKGGGRDIYITDVFPAPETIASIMEPIKRGIKMNQTAALTAGNSSLSLLNANSEDVLLLDNPIAPSETMDIEDEKEIASQFSSVNTEPEDDVLSKAAETLLDK
jgi:Recombination directionality factor-like